MTEAQRHVLAEIGSGRGLEFYSDAARTRFTARHLAALRDMGLIKLERKPGAFGALGHWAFITDAGRRVLESPKARGQS